ncbi:MAG TPA: hypothetical protein VGW38_03740 [Chloroflexota bacterium]|nr:hypothetical protein [Chloroflexota bacterium]
MNSKFERQISEIEERLHLNDGEWCPECGYGQQVLILMEGEPEPICETCERPKARGEGIRIIEFRTREDGPQ